MTTNWTSRLRLAVAGLFLLSSPAWAQPADDEETTVIRRGAPADDEETTLIRKAAPADDEETTLIRKAAPTDGEETTLIRRPVKRPKRKKRSSTRSRLNGYFHHKAAFDTQHEGNGEDVFDLRTKLSLSLEVRHDNGRKAFVSGRLTHFGVGEGSCPDESWYLLNSTATKYDYEAELREAYVYLPHDWVNLRIGNQIVRWGYGQFNKPSDVLNPMDYREGLFTDLEVPLIPNFMIHLDRTFGDVNLSAVWIPFFMPNRANLFGQDWAPTASAAGSPAFASMAQMGMMMDSVANLIDPAIEDEIQPILLATNPPDARLENGQWGARAAWKLWDVDFSLSYLFGWDKLPWVNVNQQFVGQMQSVLGDVAQVKAFADAHPEFFAGIKNIDPTNLGSASDMITAMDEIGKDPKTSEQFTAAMEALDRIMAFDMNQFAGMKAEDLFSTSYKRQHTVGFSFTTVLFDKVGFKVDSAFSPSRTLFLGNKDVSTDPSIPAFPEASSQPTVSYSVGLDYMKGSQFQIMGEFYHFHVFDLPAGKEVFLLGNDLYMVTLASYLRFLEYDALEFQLAGMFEIHSQSVFAMPKVSYKFTDNIKAGVGAMIVEALDNDKMGPGTLFDRNDQVYAEFKWSF
jgi:hypothetical protein